MGKRGSGILSFTWIAMAWLIQGTDATVKELEVTIVINGDQASFNPTDGKAAIGSCLEIDPENEVADKGTTSIEGANKYEAVFDVILPWGEGTTYKTLNDVEARFVNDEGNSLQHDLRALEWDTSVPVKVVDPSAPPPSTQSPTSPPEPMTQLQETAAPVTSISSTVPTSLNPLVTTTAESSLAPPPPTTLPSSSLPLTTDIPTARAATTVRYGLNTTWQQTDSYFKDNTHSFVSALATALNIPQNSISDRGPKSSTLGSDYIWVSFDVEVEAGHTLDDGVGKAIFDALHEISDFETVAAPGHLQSLISLKFVPQMLTIKHDATGAIYSGPSAPATTTPVPVMTQEPGGQPSSRKALRVFTTKQQLAATMSVEEAEAQREEIRVDIARSCFVPDENVTIISILPGSVIITFEVTTNTDVNADGDTVRSALENQTVAGGNLGNYSVQTVTVVVTVYQDQHQAVKVYMEDWVAVTAVAIVGVLLILVIVVASCLIVMMIGKKKKKKKKKNKNVNPELSSTTEEDKSLFYPRDQTDAKSLGGSSMSGPLTPQQRHLNFLHEQQQQQLLVMQQMLSSQQAAVMISQQKQKGPQPGILVSQSTEPNEEPSCANVSPSAHHVTENQQPSTQLFVT